VDSNSAAGVSVSYECFAFSGKGLVQRIPTRCRVSKKSDFETSTMTKLKPINDGETNEELDKLIKHRNITITLKLKD
jgi:hypothetical protein